VLVALATSLPDGWFGRATDASKWKLFDFDSDPITGAGFPFLAAFFGGTLLAMATHGADQLIVQRLMSTRDVRAAQKALMASGIVVFLQFAFFLVIGVMMWAFYTAAAPTGPIAGILAAALSSSLGALASATVTDVYERVTRRTLSDADRLRLGRVWTVAWAGLLILCAGLFAVYNKSTTDPIVVQAQGIAGYTYGALLGAFLLGLIVRRARQADAVVAFTATVLVMAFVILGVKFVGPSAAADKAANSLRRWDSIEINFGWARPADGVFTLSTWWYTLLGVASTLIVGGLLALRHRTPERAEATSAVV